MKSILIILLRHLKCIFCTLINSQIVTAVRRIYEGIDSQIAFAYLEKAVNDLPNVVREWKQEENQNINQQANENENNN